MLPVLYAVENVLPALLRAEHEWQSLYVDYHPPFVERLWRDWHGRRVYLHRIHPCEPGEALLHPHPWPSAMRVLAGNYEMGVGYGAGLQAPPIAARLILGPGSEYEMTDPDSWHYVRPLEESTLSLMVAGQPWGRPSPKSEKPLGPLSPRKADKLFEFFRSVYK